MTLEITIEHPSPGAATAGPSRGATPGVTPVVSSTTAIWLFPGLGCRYVGMGHEIIGRFAVADRLIASAEAVLGYDVARVCLEGSGRKQVPARQEAEVIYVLECAYAAVLTELGFHPCAASGHSLGNVAAGWACGAYGFTAGLEMVSRVERLLEELVDGRGQAMALILGLEQPAVLSLLAAHPQVFLANSNSPAQFVVAGPDGEVAQVLAAAIPLGAKRASLLPNRWAVHSPWMRDVTARFREYLEFVAWSRPRVPFVRSDDGRRVRTAAGMRKFLGDFLELPVRWESTVRVLRENWGDSFTELGPGNLLSKMMVHIDRSAIIRTSGEIVAC